jgi:hypothetical protein
MATEFVTDPSIKLFGACAVVDVRVARHKCAVREMFEVCERNSSEIHLASLISPFDDWNYRCCYLFLFRSKYIRSFKISEILI